MPNIFEPNGAINQIPPDTTLQQGNMPKSFMAVLGALAPIASTIVQAIINRKATDRQNEYNSPVNQMARLKDAGINPYSAYGQVASQNSSAQYTPAQVRLQDSINAVYQAFQLKDLQETTRNKSLQNDILENNLQYQDKFNSARLSNYVDQSILNQLRQKFLDGQITQQQYLNFVNSFRIKRGENEGSHSLFHTLENFGFTDLPDEIPLGVAQQALSALRSSLSGQFDLETYGVNLEMSAARKNFLQKQLDFLTEQLEHAKTMNDKTEKWFVVNQIVSMIQALAGAFSGFTGGVRSIDLIQNNPYGNL